MENKDELEKIIKKFRHSSQTFLELWEDLRKTTDSEIPIDDDNHLKEKILLDSQSEEFSWKIVLIGDGAVGKTSLRKRYLGEDFSFEYRQTIGADFAIHKDNIGSNKVKFVIWDLAGQPRFDKVRKGFYRGCHGALIVCDITNVNSFENIKYWINELWKSNDKGPVPFTIVTNKIDLEELGLRSIPQERIKRLASVINRETLRRYGFGVKSIFTSAKTGDNVTQAFKLLGIQIIAYNRFTEKKYKKLYLKEEN